MYTLYVLGPAFGLPSIDAECNAAVALLKLHFGDDSNSNDEWEMIPSHDHTITLPSLQTPEGRHNGFGAIARSLSLHSTSTKDAAAVADTTALSCLLSSLASQLLAISLYVSSTNYASTTSRAFTAILPWHANYILPPARRRAARTMTDHLGVRGIDVDNVHEDMSNRMDGAGAVGKGDADAGFERQARERASLLLPRRETLRGLLGRPETSAIFRLDALASEFFDGLQEWLEEGKGEFLLGGKEVGDVDCLAYGYLSLMLYPDVEQDWLAKTMRGRYKRLVEYTEKVHERLRLGTRVEDVLDLAKCDTRDDVVGRRRARGMGLPWTPPAKPTVVETTGTILKAVVEQIPFFAPSPTITTIRREPVPLWRQHFSAILIGTLASIALGAYYALETGLLVWPHGDRVQIFGRKRFTDYGHLGAALSGIGLLGQQATMDRRYHEQVEVAENPVVVGVSVEEEKM